MNTDQKANAIIKAIENGDSIESIKNTICTDSNDWHRCSSKAYILFLAQAKRNRKKDEMKPNVLCTSNDEIEEIIDQNNILADYALLMNIFSTSVDLAEIKKLTPQLPSSESKLIQLIGNVTMHPKMRVLQKKGRIEKFEHFKIFTKLIDAATLSYYRTNFISCYLTLLPIIEGITIRWMGYTETDSKPEFEEIRKFFQNSFRRQPCPTNPLFYNVFIKGCDKILNEHFYKPTQNGNSYANFNRHVASHILNDNQFATKENCIRLFILLDTMTEIYLYESKKADPRFNLTNEETTHEIDLLKSVILENLNESPEHKLLDTGINDLF